MKKIYFVGIGAAGYAVFETVSGSDVMVSGWYYEFSDARNKMVQLQAKYKRISKLLNS